MANVHLSGLISQGAGPHFTWRGRTFSLPMIMERSVCIVDDCPQARNPHAAPLAGIAGRRLRALMGLSIDAETMYRLFDCTHLYGERPLRWDPELACVKAVALGISSAASLLVLIGARVQDAFGFRPWRPEGKCCFVQIECLTRKPLAFLVPSLTTHLFADHRLCNRVEHSMKLALRVARGEPLSDVLCVQHGMERMVALEKGPDRRLYECGCEVLV